MRVAVRCDASVRIGTGHLHRCLSLAEALRDLGAEVRFIVRRHDAVAERIMASRSLPVCWLPASDEVAPSDVNASSHAHAAWAGDSEAGDALQTIDAIRQWEPDWAIVDHYALGAAWHRAVRKGLSCAILAVDDLGDRELAADVLLDANAAVDHAEKYAGRLQVGTRTFFGPRFALLAAAYRSAPAYTPSASVRSIGIFMGGMDEHGASGAALDILRKEVGFAGPIEIVTTASSPHVAAVERQSAEDGGTTVSLNLPDLSAFFARHDLHVGAGGTSSYERACIGVPTIAVVLAENQLAVVPVLQQLGIVSGAVIPGIAPTKLLSGANPLSMIAAELIAQPERRLAMAERARALVDGRGTERVALWLLADNLALRGAGMEDAAMLHAWRNHPETRVVSGDGTEIAYDDHLRWLSTVLASPTRRLFVAVVGSLPVGAIRFDLNEHEAWEISLYIDPALHGLGLGPRMLAAGEQALLAECAGEGICIFHAKVEAGNARSARMFEQAGYGAHCDRLIKHRAAELRQ